MAASAAPDERAARLHAEAIIIDGLNVSRWSRAQFARMQAGGLTAANCTLAINEGFRDTISAASAWYGHLREHADLIRPVETAADIGRAKAEGRVGVIFGFQNSSPFEDDLRTVEVFHRLGLRVCQLTFNTRNYVGDGCWERTDAGLSYFGLDLIRELNRLGVLIDLSHVGDRTARETIEASAQPCAFTHVGCRAITDVPRNKPDALLRAVAERGGMVGIVAFPVFIVRHGPATFDDYLAHIDHAVSLIGPEHVAIGTDHTEGHGPEFFEPLRYGKGRTPLYTFTTADALARPAELASITDHPRLTEALLRRGYDELTVRGIMGGNWLRLFGQVWGG